MSVAAPPPDQPQRWERLFGIPFSTAVFGTLLLIAAGQVESDDEPAYRCQVPFQNVREAVDIGISDPARLEAINSEEDDLACGEEVDIVRDILDGVAVEP